MAKVLAWLVLHLVILGLAFVGFVRWQLNLGLDSLLSGSAGERLVAFGDTAPRGWSGWHRLTGGMRLRLWPKSGR